MSDISGSNSSNQLIILKTNRPLSNKNFWTAYDYFLKMKEKGLILVGPEYEVLYAGPDVNIQIEHSEKKSAHTSSAIKTKTLTSEKGSWTFKGDCVDHVFMSDYGVPYFKM